MKRPTPDHLSALKESGFRLTKARRMIFTILKKAERPLSAVELVAAMKKGGVTADKTTVYRELTFLVGQGLALAVQFGDRMKRYELRLGHHHHLVCTECGAVVDVALKGDLDAVEKRLAKKSGFRIDDHSLEFFGLCPECR